MSLPCDRRSAPDGCASCVSCSPKAWCSRRLGGVLGVAVGAAILKAAPSLVPPGLLPQSVPLAFDQRVLVFSVATTRRRCDPVRPGAGLAGDEHVAGARHVAGRTYRDGAEARSCGSGLAIAEVAVAVLLLCGAGLLLRTLLTLEDVDPGIARANY